MNQINQINPPAVTLHGFKSALQAMSPVQKGGGERRKECRAPCSFQRNGGSKKFVVSVDSSTLLSRRPFMALIKQWFLTLFLAPFSYEANDLRYEKK
jgi:hypothetical protein